MHDPLLTLVDLPAEHTVVSSPPWLARPARDTATSMLFLASQPHSQALLRQDHEHRAIRQALTACPRGPTIALTSEWAVPVHGLQTALLTHSPRIVHLSTHGDPSGELLLADEAGYQAITPDSLAALLSLFVRSVHLVVLGACFSARAARAASAHIPAAIGVQGPIDDRSAIVFAAALYRGLAFGRSLFDSFHLARNELSLYGAPDADQVTLFCRPDTNPRSFYLTTNAPTEHTRISANQRPAGRPSLVGVPALATQEVGRTTVLDDLERAFTCDRHATTPAAVCIHGLPGMGKSELATRLCHRLATRRSHAGGIFWLDGRSGDFTASLGQQIADALKLPAAPVAERAAMAVRVLERQPERVLLVLDDVTKWPPSATSQPLPRAPHIDMLMTTEFRGLGGSHFRHVALEPLPLDDARTLFSAIVPQTTGDPDKDAIDHLLVQLAGHPLAIELTASYLAEHPECTPEQYLAELMQLSETVYGQTSDIQGPQHMVHVVFAALWQRLSPETRNAWLVAACFARSGASLALAESVGLDRHARRALVRAHLIAVTPEHTMRMHCLAREFARRAGTRQDRRSARRAFVSGCETWMRQVTGWIDSPVGFAMFLAERDNILDYAVRMAEALYSDKAPLLASLRAHAAMGCHAAGNLEQARRLLKRALANEHLEAAERAHWRAHLALVYADSGQFARACTLIDKALATAVRAHGERHPLVIDWRARKAHILAGRDALLRQARDLLVRCLDDEIRLLGATHVRCAQRRVQLALVLRDLGELRRARCNAQTALDQLQAGNVAPGHRTMTQARVALGTILVDMNQAAQGCVLIECALTDSVRSFGDEHPAVGILQSELAWASFVLGPTHYDRAQALLETSVQYAERLLGRAHPIVAVRRMHLALLLDATGDEVRARALLTQAVATDVTTPGLDSTTLGTSTLLATTFARTVNGSQCGAWNASAQRRRIGILWRRALAALSQRLGHSHPRIATWKRHIATLDQRIDDAVAAGSTASG